MRNIKGVEILRAIIFIMDKNAGEPILSEREMELNDEIAEFLIRHITRISGDEEARCIVFNNENNIVKDTAASILKDSGDFLDNSKEIAKAYYSYLMNSEDSSGDLIVCLFHCEYGLSLGIMKLDYNKTYIHNIDYVEGSMAITIQPQMIGLPGAGQKIQKCVIYNFENNVCEGLVLDRQSKRDGEEAPGSLGFMDFLMGNIINDKRDVTKNIIKTSEKWIRDNLNEDAGTAEKVRRVVATALKSDDIVNIDSVAHHAFDNNEQLKEGYINSLRDAGIEEKEINVDREWAEKKLNRKKLKIDKDIEIYINSMAYEDSERFEIKRNGDGTINIVIKHVRNYIEKA